MEDKIYIVEYRDYERESSWMYREYCDTLEEAMNYKNFLVDHGKYGVDYYTVKKITERSMKTYDEYRIEIKVSIDTESDDISADLLVYESLIKKKDIVTNCRERIISIDKIFIGEDNNKKSYKVLFDILYDKDSKFKPSVIDEYICKPLETKWNIINEHLLIFDYDDLLKKIIYTIKDEINKEWKM